MNTKCIIRTVVRIAIGILFIFSGYVKAIDPIGSAIKFGEYFEAFGMHFLEPGALVFGILLAVLELMIGLCFLLGLQMKLASLGALLFMAFMTILTLVLAITDAVEDCGCFGDAIKLDNWQTFYKNLIIDPFVIYAFIERKKFKKILCCKAEWGVIALLLIGSVGISVYTYRHLPFIDFMAYKVGVNIPEAMIMPEDAPQDVYEDGTFIYEKNGEKKTFTLDNLPDSTWTFVDAPTPKLLKKGYVPPAQGFTIAQDNVDIHEEIFEVGGYLVFINADDMNKAKTHKAAMLNDLYDYSSENGVNFMMLSGSSETLDQAYAQKTGAEYPIYFTDATILKSMVRSNPGMMLLKDNTILKKWNYNDLPTVDEFKKVLNEDPGKIIDKHYRNMSIINYTLLFIVIALFIVLSLKAIRNNKQK